MIKKWMKTSKNSESGQIVIAMIIAAVVMSSGLLLYQYLGDAQNQTSRLKDYADANLVANHILNVARAEVMRTPTVGAVMGGGTGDSIDTFRDFTQNKELLYTKEDTTCTPASWVGVALAKQYSQVVDLTMANIEKVSVMVRASSMPDLMNLTRKVQFEVRVKSKAHKGVSSFEVIAKKNYMLRIATTNYFGVILRNLASTGASLITQIQSPGFRNPGTTNDFAGVYFKGAAFIDITGGSGTSGDDIVLNQVTMMDQLLDPTKASKVIFDKAYGQARAILIPDGFRVEDMKLTFPNGIETGLFHASFGKAMHIPWNNDDPGWNIPMDYSGSKGVPYLAGSLPIFYQGSPITNNVADPAKLVAAANTTLPNALLGYAKVHDTCDPVKPFVFLGGDTQNLTIDFSGANTVADWSLVFCGQVRANKITIKTPTGASPTGSYDVVMLGNFIAKQIEIDNGNRSAPGPFYKVHFLNPFDNPSLPAGVTLPNSLYPSSLYALYYSYSGSETRNFFLPLYDDGIVPRPYGTLMPYGNVNPADNYFTNCSSPTTDAPVGSCAASSNCRCRKTTPPNAVHSTILGGSYNKDRFAILMEESL